MTESEFLMQLERLVERCPEFTLERVERGGDIVLRRRNSQTSARAQNMAAAFQAIMSADGKKRGGGGWI